MDRQAQEYAAAMSYQQNQYGAFPPQPQPQQQYAQPQFQTGQYMPPHHSSLPQYPPFASHPVPPPQQPGPPHQFYSHPPPPPYAAGGAPRHQQSPPPFGVTHHLPPPHYMPQHHHHPPPPPPVGPPADLELQKRIDKLVEYIAKNGPEFEIMIREKQHDNPDYAFIFGGEGHGYYNYRLFLIGGSHFTPPPPYPHISTHATPPPQMPHQIPLNHHQYYDHQLYSPIQFKGLSGPLPSDVAAELDEVMRGLSGTKESIKAAKSWFFQRSPFAPALAEALRDRVFAMDDAERQLHVVFLANDILFESLQHRANPHELDNQAHALLPVLGAMLSRVYNNPVNREENQSRLQKILQFWASKEVFDQNIISNLEREMKAGTGISITHAHVDVPTPVPSGFQQQPESQLNPNISIPPGPAHLSQYTLPPQPTFPVSLTAIPAIPIAAPAPVPSDPNPPPYPLFPPGLIPGMVRKMQIGSGVPYSPLSPLDIPSIIPPSTVSQSEILERVSKFFREIGEANPSEGPMRRDETGDGYDNFEREAEDRESLVRKGGACIPPPPNLQTVDPETGMYPDGSVPSSGKAGSSGRLGLGAAADPNESSQYDDVYSSYRKQRSTTYHSTITARSTAR